MSVRVSVESLSGCAWNGCPSQRGIRSEAILRSYPGLDAYAFSCEVGAMKPDVKIYRETCNLLAASPLTTSMIGDSLRCDRDGPRAFGINGFYLDRARGMGDYADLVEFALDVLHNADK